MKKLICAMLLLGIIAPGFAQKEKEQTALESMVATELAFAKMAKDVGTRPAFSAFIADDGILFRPGPVKGKEWLAKNPAPAPASGKRPWLSWYPTVAHISDMGDMGYTTGPWEFRPDINDAKAVAFGNFLTVWKKQADGSWKFVIDLGISGPQPSETIAAWQPPKEPKWFEGGFGPGRTDKKYITDLMEREREFSRDSASRGARVAFEDRADRDVRFFREGQQPMGKADAGSFLIAAMNNWTWEPAFADVSHGGDLGYTYGTYRIASKDTPSKNVESGYYYRIWKNHGGKWVVVADLTNPVAEEKKN